MAQIKRVLNYLLFWNMPGSNAVTEKLMNITGVLCIATAFMLFIKNAILGKLTLITGGIVFCLFFSGYLFKKGSGSILIIYLILFKYLWSNCVGVILYALQHLNYQFIMLVIQNSLFVLLLTFTLVIFVIICAQLTRLLSVDKKMMNNPIHKKYLDILMVIIGILALCSIALEVYALITIETAPFDDGPFIEIIRRIWLPQVNYILFLFFASFLGLRRWKGLPIIMVPCSLIWLPNFLSSLNYYFHVSEKSLIGMLIMFIGSMIFILGYISLLLLINRFRNNKIRLQIA